MITQVRRSMWRGDEAGITHSIAARLHPPAAMSAAEWSQATEQSKKPDRAAHGRASKFIQIRRQRGPGEETWP